MIFTKEKSNEGRQKELDFAKGIAIVFMIWVHINESYLSELASNRMYSKVIEFLGSPPAAPIFMLLLGTGIVYSKRSTAIVLFKRGTYLLGLGYILNFLRDFVPCFILSKINNDVSYVIDGWELLWGIDILQFAGLVFIFFALVKKLKIKNITLFLVWCGFLSINLLVRGISFDSEILNRLMGLLWGTDEFSWFPFFTWVTFPIAGYYFGQAIIRCKDKNTFYKYLLLVSGSISIPLWIYSYINNVRFGAFGDLYQTEYYHHDMMGNIVLIAFALFWLSLCFIISKYVPKIIYKNIRRWSNNITQMYCIHQLIIGILLLVLEENAYMPMAMFILSAAVFIVTDLLCIFINNIKANKLSLKKVRVSYAHN